MAAQFGYLLNAMEHAALAHKPAEHDYCGKRLAVLDHVAALETENESLQADIARHVATCAEQAREIERLESLARNEKNYWKQVGMNYEKRKQAMQQIIDGQQKQIEGLASFYQSDAALAAKGEV